VQTSPSASLTLTRCALGADLPVSLYVRCRARPPVHHAARRGRPARGAKPVAGTPNPNPTPTPTPNPDPDPNPDPITLTLALTLTLTLTLPLALSLTIALI
jgi:hypothetical protein